MMMMTKYLRISVILFTFIINSESEDFDTTYPSDHIKWHDWEECEHENDDDYLKSEYCWYVRKPDCQNATKIGCTTKKIFQQKIYGCVSCPSGGWKQDEEGWSLCQSRDCESATRERKYTCNDYSDCTLIEESFCTPPVTCNGTYGSWEVIRECETCTQGDIKVLRKQCMYNGKLNAQCANHTYQTVTKNVVCSSKDCNKRKDKLEIEWGEWSMCSYDQAKQLTRSRKCIKNCHTATASQIVEVQPCPDSGEAVKQDVQPILECDCLPKIVTIGFIICSAVSSTGCCVFGFLCCRRRRKKKNKKEKNSFDDDEEEENIYEEVDA